MANPQTDVEARLRQIHEEVGAILEGEEARTVDGQSAGTLEDLTGVVFGLDGRNTDVRVTQEPGDPPAAAFAMLGYYLDAMAAATGHPPLHVAKHAVDVMDQLQAQEGFEQTGWVTIEEEGDG